VIFDRYDVVVVPFPFDDMPVRKRRPVVVLSGKAFNATNGQTVVAMITTAKETDWPSDLAIQQLDDAGLKQPCVIRMRLLTIPNGLIVRQIGALAGVDRQRLGRLFDTIFQ
jgi:mRNA interferase MazF